jgi:hypothetical protein
MTNMGGGAGMTRGGGGKVIPTLTFTSAKPCWECPVNARRAAPTNNMMNIFLCIE